MNSSIVLTDEQLHEQRDELLRRIGLDYDELSQRAETHTLRADERQVWDSVSGIDFLLGDDDG